MKAYPFDELDYLIRENGTGPFLTYIGEPNDSNLQVLQAGVPQRIQSAIDSHFWDVVCRIAYSDGDTPSKIQTVLEYCFELAFNIIKDNWYNPDADDGYRRFLSAQYSKSISESTRSIEEKPEWIDYQQQYHAAHENFVRRLSRNLAGYTVNLVDNSTQTRQPTVADTLQEEALMSFEGDAVPPGNVFGYLRGTYYANEQDYEAFIERAWITLRRNRLITASSKSAFRRIFLGRATEPIIWNGSKNKLHYLITRLFDVGVICGDGGKWQLTVACFRLSTGPIPIAALHRTKAPVGLAGRIIEEITSDLIG